jgi:hypothetical protein
VATQFQPVAGCLESATEMQTVLALSVLHLFKDGLNPDPSTPLADYTAAEADYDTYAAITLTAWNNPILAPGTGYMTMSPAVQFAVGPSDPVTPNLIQGCYMLDAAGNLRLVVIFDAPLPMQVAGQGIPIQLSWLFPTGV